MLPCLAIIGKRRMKQTAVITGAGAGIGKACARYFANQGYRVVVTDIDPDRAAQAIAEITEAGSEAIGVTGDISLEDTARDIREKTLGAWGRIDVLVANAGIQTGGSLLDTGERDWDRVIAVNLKGVAHSCKSVLPAMREQQHGAIVIVSSVNALVGSAGMAMYDASKAAVLALMRNLAVENGEYGIRVNGVCPGATITDYHLQRAAGKGISAQQLRETARGYGLLGRAAEPEEIAGAIYFLASAEASFITGQTLFVDGGFSVTSNP